MSEVGWKQISAIGKTGVANSQTEFDSLEIANEFDLA